MAVLFQNPDGANDQARAVLAYLQGRDGIEESWDDKQLRYLAKPEVDRWHNCREQGYVVALRIGAEQLNIAFFEHRNSDSICALEWECSTLNPPTIADVTGPYVESKYAVSHSTKYGEASQMADWVFERLTAFWIVKTARKKVA